MVPTNSLDPSITRLFHWSILITTLKKKVLVIGLTGPPVKPRKKSWETGSNALD
jgi:hypothetical protein